MPFSETVALSTDQPKRTLGAVDLPIFDMIFMVPIAPFAVFGFVWHDAKGMVPLAYLIGMVCMVFIARSYAAMSRAFASAGSFSTYAQRGLGEAAGFFAGWLMLLDYVLVPALLYIVSAAALHPLLPGVPTWVWLASFIAFNSVIFVQMSAKVSRGLLLFELVVLAVFVVGLTALRWPATVSCRAVSALQHALCQHHRGRRRVAGFRPGVRGTARGPDAPGQLRCARRLHAVAQRGGQPLPAPRRVAAMDPLRRRLCAGLRHHHVRHGRDGPTRADIRKPVAAPRHRLLPRAHPRAAATREAGGLVFCLRYAT